MTILGVSNNTRLSFLDTDTYRYFIRSYVHAASTSHQLYVVNNYGGDWRFWVRAADEEGAAHDLTRIETHIESCNSSGCSKSETFGVDLDGEQLTRLHEHGLQIKIYARNGSERILQISPWQIDAQMSAIANTKLPTSASK